MDARQVTELKQPGCSRVDLCLSYCKENTGASVAFWNGGHVCRGSDALICILWDSCLKHSTEVRSYLSGKETLCIKLENHRKENKPPPHKGRPFQVS